MRRRYRKSRRDWSCPSRKVRFANRESAKTSSARDHQRMYRCPDCKGWHFTSQ